MGYLRSLFGKLKRGGNLTPTPYSSGHRGGSGSSLQLPVYTRLILYVKPLARVPICKLVGTLDLGDSGLYIVYTCPRLTHDPRLAYVMSSCAITLLRNCAVTQYLYASFNLYRLTHNPPKKQSIHAIEQACISLVDLFVSCLSCPIVSHFAISCQCVKLYLAH